MASRAPAVMVSSTFYDLRQIRADLTAFIVDDLGYVPLLSELNSFPVDPDAATIENCRRRVEEDADILVMIIGGRYGSVDSETARSVTNLEYLAARAKGIPIYAFVEKRVLAVVPVWRQNPDANMTGIVDDPRVLQFIDQVRSVDKVWTHEFDSARDIIDVLRMQFAYLMAEGLSWRQQLRQRSRESRLLERLRGQPLRLALERRPDWEYRLFGQLLADEVESWCDLKRDYTLGVVLDLGQYLALEDFHPWMRARMSELKRTVAAAVKLVNEVAPQAFGPPGTPGDPEAIVFVARRISDIYRHLLEWAQMVRRATVDERLTAVVTELAGFADDIIGQIESLGPRILAGIDEAMGQPPGEGPKVVRVTLELAIPNVDRFEKALDKALLELGLA